jgi:hypothetical protein
MYPANDTTVFGLEQFIFEKKTTPPIITETQKLKRIFYKSHFGPRNAEIIVTIGNIANFQLYMKTMLLINVSTYKQLSRITAGDHSFCIDTHASQNSQSIKSSNAGTQPK